MINADIFDACTRRLIAEEQVEEAAIRKLRSKLGFPGDTQDILPASSRDLPINVPVVVVQKARAAIRGRVFSNGESSLTVSLDNEPATSMLDGPATVYFQNLAGFFSFSTQVTAQDERGIHLLHSETINRYQRRRYSRRKLQLLVFVYPYRSESTPGKATPHKSILMDLSGGGQACKIREDGFRSISRSSSPSHRGEISSMSSARSIGYPEAEMWST